MRSASLPATLMLVLASLGAAFGPAGCATSPRDPSVMEAENIRRSMGVAEAGERLTEAGKYEDALDKFREAVILNRRNFAAWNNLGVVLMEQNRALEAAEAFRTASELAPGDARPLKNLGDLWQKQGYLAEAAEFYYKAIEVNPDYLEAYREAVRVDHLRENRTFAAKDRVREALLREQDPAWREFFRRQKVLLDQAVPDPSGVAVPRPGSGSGGGGGGGGAGDGVNPARGGAGNRPAGAGAGGGGGVGGGRGVGGGGS
ncbi:MAG: tetratricopeptide repeat protein [bacterium]